MKIHSVQGGFRVPPMLPWNAFLQPARPLFYYLCMLAVIQGYQEAPTVKMVFNLKDDKLGEG